MDVAKEREACSDDAGLSESWDVSIDLGNCTKDERDVVVDEVQLDDEDKESKGLDQEVKKCQMERQQKLPRH
ncbi:hypothetical protein SDJN03_15933, partial [Cucurbita argyrosperma subsp. sororia]